MKPAYLLLLASLRVFETVLPSLAYGPSCWSSVTVHNLSNRAATVDVEAHKESGALIPLLGLRSATVRLEAGEQRTYKLPSGEEIGGAWVLVRETIPSDDLAVVVAVSGTTECISGDRLRTASREVVYPVQNAWFSSDVSEIRGETISVVNASEYAASASACYSSGTLVSLPGDTQQTDVCSTLREVQIPPFGTTVFPVEHGGNSRFSLKTAGDKIALQMLRPLEPRIRMYSVDSTIKFGGEVGNESRMSIH